MIKEVFICVVREGRGESHIVLEGHGEGHIDINCLLKIWLWKPVSLNLFILARMRQMHQVYLKRCPVRFLGLGPVFGVFF